MCFRGLCSAPGPRAPERRLHVFDCLDEPENPDIIGLTAGEGAIYASAIIHHTRGYSSSVVCRRRQLTEDEENSALCITVHLMALDIWRAPRIAKDFGIYTHDAYFMYCSRNMAVALLLWTRK